MSSSAFPSLRAESGGDVNRDEQRELIEDCSCSADWPILKDMIKYKLAEVRLGLPTFST
jgi:hypothetical protein